MPGTAVGSQPLSTPLVEQARPPTRTRPTFSPAGSRSLRTNPAGPHAPGAGELKARLPGHAGPEGVERPAAERHGAEVEEADALEGVAEERGQQLGRPRALNLDAEQDRVALAQVR